LTGQSKNQLKEEVAGQDWALSRTRQFLPGGLLIKGMEILRLCGVGTATSARQLE
jgi:hypothetical protein